MSWWGPSWTSTTTSTASTSAATHNSDVGGSSNLTTVTSSSALFGEDLLLADENEDALVNQLLTQFPAYGSNSRLLYNTTSNSATLQQQQQQARMQQQHHRMETMPSAQEWLQMGVGLQDDDDDEEIKDEKKEPDGTIRRRNSASRSATTTRTGETTTATTTPRSNIHSNKATTATTAAAISKVLEEWDAQEQNLWRTARADHTETRLPDNDEQRLTVRPSSFPHKHRLVDAPHRTADTASSTTAAAVAAVVVVVAASDVTDDRQHWMPDQLCKQCYSCELPFTVFRRRHHCRLCGQVFCNACSAHFVPNSTIRVCHLCHEQVQETQQQQQQGRLVVPEDNHGDSSTVPQQQQQQQQQQEKATTVPPPVQQGTTKTAAVPPPMDGASDPIKEGHRHLGRMAASHLEMVATELLSSHAPILWNSLSADSEKKNWINKLLTLVTQCCATVTPNVAKSDFLDIRPYVKVKTIPGGSYTDCAYLSGVLFRKTVSHKKMAKELDNPRILLLSGGIEFFTTRSTENRIASLETLFEQEDKYMEILVGKIILKLKPDVLLVGRSVSRRAQELLLKAQVVLVQHVKATLLRRIARQTGATILSSTDHVMTQFVLGNNNNGSTNNTNNNSVLGHCRRFRLVTVRNHERWVMEDHAQHQDSTSSPPQPRAVQREAALAAQQLGSGVMDGSLAIKSGLAKRGVANTYIMLEGCPKHLGCTVVLRGASTAALKQVKTVFRFLTHVAYNLRLETSYWRDRGARLRPDFVVARPEHRFSSSLAVDFGKPPTGGRKIRPWNGGTTEVIPRLESGEITAFDHQSILITSVWMTDKSQCCPAEVKGICYYSMQDVALGQFLRDSCFNLSLKCQNPNCKKSVLDHSLSFVHNDGLINIMVRAICCSLFAEVVF